MSDGDCCICGHPAESHDANLGYCEVRACRCIMYRLEDDGFDEEDDDVEELNFDDDAA